MKTPPDKSLGGTFHYAADGTFVSHEPPTRPGPPIEIPAPPGDSFGQAPGGHIDPPPAPPAQPARKRPKE